MPPKGTFNCKRVVGLFLSVGERESYTHILPAPSRAHVRGSCRTHHSDESHELNWSDVFLSQLTVFAAAQNVRGCAETSTHSMRAT
jgi:hypothetical protein